MVNEENMERLPVDKFSTDFLVECILQHLDGVSFPRYGGITVGGKQQDGKQHDIKKWLRLTETFFHCLKQDVKSIKCNSDKVCNKSTREAVADVIAHWFPDLDQIRKINLHTEQQTAIEQNTLTSEAEVISQHVETLYNMAKHIYERDCLRKQEREKHVKKSEVVFVYDDEV